MAVAGSVEGSAATNAGTLVAVGVAIVGATWACVATIGGLASVVDAAASNGELSPGPVDGEVPCPQPESPAMIRPVHNQPNLDPRHPVDSCWSPWRYVRCLAGSVADTEEIVGEQLRAKSRINVKAPEPNVAAGKLTAPFR